LVGWEAKVKGELQASSHVAIVVIVVVGATVVLAGSTAS